jgi:uncharacterized protein (TIRG00374 family)
VLVVVSREADDVPGAVDVLSDASLPWLAAALAVQVLNYAFLGFQLGRLVGGEPRLGKRVAVRVALVVYGLGTLLPGAPAPGMVIAATELSRRGIDRGRAALAFFLSAWFNVRSFLVLAMLTAISATLRGRVPDDSRALVLGSAGFIAAALALTAAIVRRPALGDRVGRILEALDWHGTGRTARQDTTRLQATALGVVASRRDGFLIASATLASRLTDAVCLRLALVAVGIHVSMGVVLVAYVVSIVASSVPLLPGGLGLVEAAVPELLHHYGVPLDAAVAGTIAWRVVTLLLPALAGLASYASLRLQTPTVSPPPRASLGP